MKIVYCLNSIKGLGGIQVATIYKANALLEIEGNEIYVVVSDHKEEHSQFAYLDSRIKFIHLPVNYYDDDYIGGLKVKINQYFKRQKHKRLLTKLLNEIKPEIVISVGQSEKYLFPIKVFRSLYGKYILIREFHFDTNYRISLAKNFKGLVIGKLKNFIDYVFFDRIFYDALVVLTPEDKNDNWSGRKNVYQIANPITIKNEFSQIKESKDSYIIISFGRLSYQKNFFYLIEAFSKIDNSNKKWQLHIYGDGEDKILLENLIKKLNLEHHIFIFPSTKNVVDKLRNADIFAMSSRMEGLPLVMIEAMAAGLPIIANDFKYGPRYLISEGENGFIVPFDNVDEYAQKLSILMKDDQLRNSMGIKSSIRSKDFLPNEIAKKWMCLFEELISQKN